MQNHSFLISIKPLDYILESYGIVPGYKKENLDTVMIRDTFKMSLHLLGRFQFFHNPIKGYWELRSPLI